jgi:hypothetical protein
MIGRIEVIMMDPITVLMRMIKEALSLKIMIEHNFV